jgi:hypothetical protein
MRQTHSRLDLSEGIKTGSAEAACSGGLEPQRAQALREIL